MGKVTDIAWADSTWNPWMGCTKISAGCKLCYMFREMKRYGRDPERIVRTSEQNWKQPLRWEPGRVFTCSWSDFFIPDADEWRPEAWEVIRRAKWHEWMILTKRPQAAWSRLPIGFPNEFEHVRIGVTVESMAYIERIDQMLYMGDLPNMLSVEPLLGPVDLTPYLRKNVLDWVVVGGETDDFGRARKTEIEWLEHIVQDCQDANVPVFVKQLGSVYEANHDINRWPESLRIQQFPPYIGRRDAYKETKVRHKGA